MNIRYHKNFDKSLEKLSPKVREKIRNSIEVFYNDPHAPQLDNHALHGKLQGFRSISAGGDIRLIFTQENNYEIATFYLAGTHSQLYD